MPVNCLDRFASEVNPCQDWYCVSESDGTFDVEKTFAPCSTKAVALKFVALVYVTFVFVYSLWDADDRAIWFGLLTNITLLFSVIYIWLSFVNSVIGVEQPRSHRDSVSGLVSAQWYMFHVAMHSKLVVVLLYWVVEFERGETDISFQSISTHAGTCLTLLLEGFYVNFIPIRWFFWWGSGLLVGVGYLIWTLIHSKLDIGNGMKEDSDLLYDAVDWEDDKKGTILLFVLCLVVIGPILHSMLFCISIYGYPCCCGTNKRRYLVDKDTDEEE